ncbi:MAG: FtsX-like permease family protein [Acidobacteriaceae bacterium]|nr:FtsX-like permease family protein [Acidobacteriaceae bacterium]
MNFVAIQMLLGDRIKYLGLVTAVAFSTFLMSHQSSIFAGVMNRTRSQILDVQDAGIWVMDPATQYFDEAKALPDQALYRVRSVEGVEWAVAMRKGTPVARAADGTFRTVILMSVDDDSLAGAPRHMLAGSLADLRQPDSLFIDRAAYYYFFPNQPFRTGRVFEINDHRVTVSGIFESSAPFTNLPIFYARYSEALKFQGRERNMMTYVLVKAKPGVDENTLCQRIARETGFHAMTTQEFGWATIDYYFKHTGIPLNFGITITVALLVGTLVAGQTFYIFTLENLKQFGALKAIGVTNWRITSMILLQAGMVGAIGYSIGIAMTAAFYEYFSKNVDLRGFFLPWQIATGTAGAVLVIIVIASFMSIRRVLVLEPAVVFRG